MSRLKTTEMEKQAQQYWIASRQWRGDITFGQVTVGDILKTVADLAGSFMNIGWNRGENLASDLLYQVINNKRCKKKTTKGPNNVVYLNERKPFQAEGQALLQEMRGDPQALVGLQVTMKIKVG